MCHKITAVFKSINIHWQILNITLLSINWKKGHSFGLMVISNGYFSENLVAVICGKFIYLVIYC